MTHDDFRQGWERLRIVYSTMPRLTPETAREWYRVLRTFSAGDYNKAIDLWIETERFKPSPSELASKCRAAQRKRLAAERAAASHGGDICPFCGGFGFVRHELLPEALDNYICCQCAASPNAEQGAAILAAATADPAWIFDSQEHAFRRRRSWIGERADRHTPAEQQHAFKQISALFGNSQINGGNSDRQ